MPKFAANLSMLFTETDFLNRFTMAAKSGFTAVEFLFPYDFDPHVLRHQLQQNQLQQVLFNMYPGDWDKGDRGLAALPDRIALFESHMQTALNYAQALNCSNIHVMSGIQSNHASEKNHRETFIRNLRVMADLFASHGITLLIEPLNPIDVPKYFINSFGKAIELIDEIARDNVKLQLDYYHAQIMEGNLSHLTRKVFPYIGHIQIAAVPDRHEPSEGEVNYPHLFNLLDQLNYQGWIGCEYRPRHNTRAGLNWINPYLSRSLH